MEQLLNLQKKYNITDKDLYILSKLSSNLKSSSLFEKQNINSKINTVLGKYKVGFVDNINILNLLKKSSVHLRPEFVEKYEDSENSEELAIAGKQGIRNLIIVFSIFVVVFLVVSSINKTNISTNGNSDNNVEVSNCNQSSHEQFVREHFNSSGNDVYGISTLGSIGNCGYNFLVNGYNQSKGTSFVCNVKTDGINGMKIIDAGCDFN